MANPEPGNFLSRVEAAVFTVMHVMTENAGAGTKMNLLMFMLIVADFLQILQLAMTVGAGWPKSHVNWIDVIVKYINFYFPRHSWSAFYVIHIVTVIIVLLCMLNATYVVHQFQTTSYERVWPMKLLRIVVTGFVTIGFIPITEILFVPISGHQLENYDYFEDDPSKQSEANVAMMQAFSVIVLAIFVPFCLLMAIADFEKNPLSSLPTASSTGRPVFYYTTVRTCNVLQNTYMSQRSRSAAWLRLLLAAVLFGHLMATLPYYSRVMNYTRSVMYLLLVWVSIGTLVIVYMRDGDASDSDVEVFATIWLCLMVPVSVCGYVLVKLRYRMLLNVLNMMGDESNDNNHADAWFGPETARLASLSTMSSAGRALGTNNQSKYSLFRKPKKDDRRKSIITEVEEGCAEVHRLSVACALRSWPMLRFLFTETDIEVMTRLILHPTDQPWIHLPGIDGPVADPNRIAQANQVYVAAKCLFPESAHVLICYAIFLKVYGQDPEKAASCLNLVNFCGPTFDQRFMSFTIQLEMEQEIHSMQLGQSSMNAISVIEFNKNFAEVSRAHEALLRRTERFWKTLSSGAVDSGVVIAKLEHIKQSRARALKVYEKLRIKYPFAKELLRAYAMFHGDMMNNPGLAARFLRKADEIEEKESKHVNDSSDMLGIGQPDTSESVSGASQSTATGAMMSRRVVNVHSSVLRDLRRVSLGIGGGSFLLIGVVVASFFIMDEEVFTPMERTVEAIEFAGARRRLTTQIALYVRLLQMHSNIPSYVPLKGYYVNETVDRIHEFTSELHTVQRYLLDDAIHFSQTTSHERELNSYFLYMKNYSDPTLALYETTAQKRFYDLMSYYGYTATLLATTDLDELDSMFAGALAFQSEEWRFVLANNFNLLDGTREFVEIYEDRIFEQSDTGTLVQGLIAGTVFLLVLILSFGVLVPAAKSLQKSIRSSKRGVGAVLSRIPRRLILRLERHYSRVGRRQRRFLAGDNDDNSQLSEEASESSTEGTTDDDGMATGESQRNAPKPPNDIYNTVSKILHAQKWRRSPVGPTSAAEPKHEFHEDPELNGLQAILPISSTGHHESEHPSVGDAYDTGVSAEDDLHVRSWIREIVWELVNSTTDGRPFSFANLSMTVVRTRRWGVAAGILKKAAVPENDISQERLHSSFHMRNQNRAALATAVGNGGGGVLRRRSATKVGPNDGSAPGSGVPPLPLDGYLQDSGYALGNSLRAREPRRSTLPLKLHKLQSDTPTLGGNGSGRHLVPRPSGSDRSWEADVYEGDPAPELTVEALRQQDELLDAAGEEPYSPLAVYLGLPVSDLLQRSDTLRAQAAQFQSTPRKVGAAAAAVWAAKALNEKRRFVESDPCTGDVLNSSMRLEPTTPLSRRADAVASPSTAKGLIRGSDDHVHSPHSSVRPWPLSGTSSVGHVSTPNTPHGHISASSTPHQARAIEAAPWPLAAIEEADLSRPLKFRRNPLHPVDGPNDDEQTRGESAGRVSDKQLTGWNARTGEELWKPGAHPDPHGDSGSTDGFEPAADSKEIEVQEVKVTLSSRGRTPTPGGRLAPHISASSFSTNDLSASKGPSLAATLGQTNEARVSDGDGVGGGSDSRVSGSSGRSHSGEVCDDDGFGAARSDDGDDTGVGVGTDMRNSEEESNASASAGGTSEARDSLGADVELPASRQELNETEPVPLSGKSGSILKAGGRFSLPSISQEESRPSNPGSSGRRVSLALPEKGASSNEEKPPPRLGAREAFRMSKRMLQASPTPKRDRLSHVEASADETPESKAIVPSRLTFDDAVKRQEDGPQLDTTPQTPGSQRILLKRHTSLIETNVEEVTKAGPRNERAKQWRKFGTRAIDRESTEHLMTNRRNSFRWIATMAAVVMCIILTLQAVNVWKTTEYAKTDSHLGAAINNAGRQRDLLWDCCRTIIELEVNDGASRQTRQMLIDRLSNNIVLFEKIHDGLRYGDDDLNLARTEGTDSRIDDLLYGTDCLWSEDRQAWDPEAKVMCDQQVTEAVNGLDVLFQSFMERFRRLVSKYTENVDSTTVNYAFASILADEDVKYVIQDYAWLFDHAVDRSVGLYYDNTYDTMDDVNRQQATMMIVTGFLLVSGLALFHGFVLRSLRKRFTIEAERIEDLLIMMPWHYVAKVPSLSEYFQAEDDF